MEKNEKKKWYVQPETEVIDMKLNAELLGSSGIGCLDDCDSEVCQEDCSDDCFDD